MHACVCVCEGVCEGVRMCLGGDHSCLDHVPELANRGVDILWWWGGWGKKRCDGGRRKRVWQWAGLTWVDDLFLVAEGH